MTAFDQRVDRIREFNRFYTRHVGALNEGLLQSSFSLTETRLLYELAHVEATSATDLARSLSLDPGYLSRLLKSFRDRGLIRSDPAPEDGRKSLISLTESGREAFAPLNKRSAEEVAGYLGQLPEPDQARLVEAMDTIRALLEPAASPAPAILLRPHRIGDIGWVIHRQSRVYAEEYGWDIGYEALVAQIAGRFLDDYDPRTDCCYIAEREGEIVGSVFVVPADHPETGPRTAKLRLLYVEASARGTGLGRRLVEEAMRFAKGAGYARMTLWTNDVLSSARGLYERLGFTMTKREAHHSFGRDLVGETWDRDL